MELLAAKITAMVLMATLALFFGLLPLKVKAALHKGSNNGCGKRKREAIISGLLCLGAGVLIATVFLHMIPETREGFALAAQSGLLGHHGHGDHEGHDGHDNHSHDSEDHPHATRRIDKDVDIDNLSDSSDGVSAAINATNDAHDEHNHEDHAHGDQDAHAHDHGHDHAHAGHDHDSHAHDHPHSHDHDHPHSHNNDNAHSHDHDHAHSHDHEHPTEVGSEEPRFDALIYNRSNDSTVNSSASNEDPHKEKVMASGGHDHSFPFAELVVCAGFFLIYFVEEVIHKIVYRSCKSSSHGHKEEAASNQTNGRTETFRAHVENDSGGIDNPVFSGDVDATAWNPKVRNSLVHSHASHIADVMQSSAVAPEETNDGEKEFSPAMMGPLRAFLMILALSFHSIFEGLAVGLQEVSRDVWYLFGAISAHKFVICFCIGFELTQSGIKRTPFIVAMTILALVTPLGIAIGIAVAEGTAAASTGSEFSSHLAVTVLQGIAGGTLLYIAFLEVLERERSKPSGRLLKFLCLIIGFAVMATIEALGGHSHAPMTKVD